VRQSVLTLYMDAAGAESDRQRDAFASAAKRLRHANRMQAALWIAAGDPKLTVHHMMLDTDPWLLNVENGTIDLRTGNLREHRREDLITKLVPTYFDPSKDAPGWDAFLNRVQPDAAMRDYLQRAIGYSITGSTREECVFLNHGGGANGKTTFIETFRLLLGDYGIALPQETVVRARFSSIPNDLAQLPGRRFATIVETGEDQRLDEERIKALATGDKLPARFMRQEWFEFEPRSKFWMATNHLPTVSGDDDGIWRRIRLVPWAVQIPEAERDRDLREKLQAELPGVLVWAVRGCLDWQRDGLRPPNAVTAATGEYREEEDVIGAFLQERCDFGPALTVSNKRLRREFSGWCEQQGHPLPSPKAVASRFSRRGMLKCKVGSDRGWRGLNVRSLEEGEHARDGWDG